MTNIDFKALNTSLLLKADLLLSEFLPGGTLIGKEYTCASILGGEGYSCRINISTGLWSDFATGETGGDLVSLYAASKKISQIEAAQYLSSRVNMPVPALVEDEPRIILPPEGTPAPNIRIAKHNCFPSKLWSYHTKDGKVNLYIARYDTQTRKKKQFCPWVWTHKGKWAAGYPAIRPLYDLHLLCKDTTRAVLIVEGERCAEAAKRLLLGRMYAVTTWPGGGKAWDHDVDWTPVYDRKILIWPDADEPGMKTANAIAQNLQMRCPEVKILDVSGKPEGWDVADLVAEGICWDEFKVWAAPLVKKVNASITPINLMTIQNTQVNIDVEADVDIYDQSLYTIWGKAGIQVSKGGIPVCNIDNCLRILEYWPEFKGKIWYDEFYCRYLTVLPNDQNSSHPIREIDRLNMAVWLQRHLGLKRISDDVVKKAMLVYGAKDIRHEPKDWIKLLKWDKKPRIKQFFSEYAGAEDNEYTQAVSINFWISLIARILQPGCKVDNMVILEGKQGAKKSTLFEEIGGKWHSENNERISNKDFLQVLRGKIIIEFADLSSWTNADVKQLKQLLSCRIDTYRKSYGEDAEDWPRQSIFVGTTNESTYLRDETGGRRYWPIKSSYIDIPKMRKDREQLFAEASVLFNQSFSWWEVPESAEIEQEQRRQFDEWEQIISKWLVSKTDATIEEIAVGSLGVTKDKLDRRSMIRIRQAMIVNGWVFGKIFREGKIVRGWVSQAGAVLNDGEEW